MVLQMVEMIKIVNLKVIILSLRNTTFFLDDNRYTLSVSLTMRMRNLIMIDFFVVRRKSVRK